MSPIERIPYQVEMNRIIELLAKQIYQSPLTLLRENCQNAYDAILLRKQTQQAFTPEIQITISTNKVIITDNGIGMTKKDLVEHYWRAGSSGKNNPVARAAGVVGTFGIGAMANFGIASSLTVITESAISGERTQCYAKRDTLSTDKECIEVSSETTTGQPGTTVVAEIPPESLLDVGAAIDYISGFVRYLDIPVTANKKLISMHKFEDSIVKPSAGWSESLKHVEFGSQFIADVEIAIAKTGEIWLRLVNIYFSGRPIKGTVILWQGMHQISTFRSRFTLAKVAVSSSYSFGGIADLTALEPTAGREAITTQSLQLLQAIVTQSDKYASEKITGMDLANLNTDFMDWASRHGRYELCNRLRVRVEPDNRSFSLEEICRNSKIKPYNYFEGSDQSIIEQYATDDEPLIIVSASQPRRRCELSYFNLYCQVRRIADAPTVLSTKPETEMSIEETAFALRLVGILQSDYFIDAQVFFGKISHRLPLYLDTTRRPITIVVDSDASSIATILRLYRQDPAALTGMAKDFVRNVIFPRISSLVPSSTRQGAEAFLRAIRQPRDVFEYEKSDLASLNEVWERYLKGDLSLKDAAQRSTVIVRTTVQTFDRSTIRRFSSVVPDVLEHEKVLKQVQELDSSESTDPLPAIMRLDKESPAKLLIIDDDEEPLKGYRCFIAITDRARGERGEFFMQPHRTEIVWGGQKVLYIFQHHSGQFGLYYELQSTDILSDTPGGKAFPTCTILLKNQIYIPVPTEIHEKFLPEEPLKRRFEVRFELLYPS